MAKEFSDKLQEWDLNDKIKRVLLIPSNSRSWDRQRLLERGNSIFFMNDSIVIKLLTKL